MNNPFADPRRLVQHARDQTAELAARIRIFFDLKPYRQITEIDIEGSQQIYKVRLTKEIPGNISIITKDILGNLRDALDHAVYASAKAFGNDNPNHTAFPFAKDAAGVKQRLSSRDLKHVPVGIHPILESFKPYDGGNAILWGLNSIRNFNTHRFIVPVGAASIGNSLVFSGDKIVAPAKLGYSEWNPEKKEVEFMRLGFGSDAKFNCQVVFDVLFSGKHLFADNSVVDTLTSISDEIDRIVIAIETETYQIFQNTKKTP